MHKPCLSLGKYTCEIGADLNEPAAAKKVDLVLHGHEHLYQRTKQLGLAPGARPCRPGAYDADCVVDADDALSQGRRHRVRHRRHRRRRAARRQRGRRRGAYFAACVGPSTPTRRYGFLDVERHGRRARRPASCRVGGTLHRRLHDHRGAPPPNQPPTAAFTSSSHRPDGTFDGRGSADPDGTIASYAWDFGDGGTGTGAQPTHPYAAAGTYPVTLTVTDDTAPPPAPTPVTVTVTAAPRPVDFVSDTFTRTV